MNRSCGVGGRGKKAYLIMHPLHCFVWSFDFSFVSSTAVTCIRLSKEDNSLGGRSRLHPYPLPLISDPYPLPSPLPLTLYPYLQRVHSFGTFLAQSLFRFRNNRIHDRSFGTIPDVMRIFGTHSVFGPNGILLCSFCFRLHNKRNGRNTGLLGIRRNASF